jgi:DNA polymerase I-like protein with 3'-5' exonuclease and polymerase domains
MSEYKLSDTIGVTKEAALDIINDYFDKVPEVKKYLAKSGLYTRKNGVSYTPMPVHRPRFFDMDVLNGMTKNQREVQLGRYERAGMNSPK